MYTTSCKVLVEHLCPGVMILLGSSICSLFGDKIGVFEFDLVVDVVWELVDNVWELDWESVCVCLMHLAVQFV